MNKVNFGKKSFFQQGWHSGPGYGEEDIISGYIVEMTVISAGMPAAIAFLHHVQW